MIRLCTFRDHDPWFRKDKTGHNKVGYVTRNDNVVYPFATRYIERPLAKLQKHSLNIVEGSQTAEYEELIETFFTQNVLNPKLMKQGFYHLTQANLDFFRNPVRLPKLDDIDDTEHNRRWNILIASVQTGDMVQVLDQGSLLSRLIAKVEQGTWSHTAVYVGNGKIQEAITDGIVVRSIEVYQSHHYRVGIYRHPKMTDQAAAKMVAFGESQLGGKYSWRNAISLGVKIFFGIKHRSKSEISPNELNALNEFQLICVV